MNYNKLSKKELISLINAQDKRIEETKKYENVFKSLLTVSTFTHSSDNFTMEYFKKILDKSHFLFSIRENSVTRQFRSFHDGNIVEIATSKGQGIITFYEKA